MLAGSRRAEYSQPVSGALRLLGPDVLWVDL